MNGIRVKFSRDRKTHSSHCKKYKERAVWVISLACLFHTARCSDSASQQDLIILGDSYSDDGSHFRAERTQLTNYSCFKEGHYSDGPVWNEYVAQHNSMRLINVARGGAEACTKHRGIPDMSDQLQQLRQLLSNDTQPRADALVAFTIGTNDHLILRRRSTQDEPSFVVGCIVTAVQQLLVLGFRQIVVWNLPSLEASPAEVMKELVPVFVRHNQLLADEMAQVQAKHPLAKIQIFDFFKAITEFAAGNPNEAVFCDHLHPTTRVHKYFAGKFDEVLKEWQYLM